MTLIENLGVAGGRNPVWGVAPPAIMPRMPGRRYERAEPELNKVRHIFAPPMMVPRA